MNTTQIKTQLHNAIDNISDVNMLKAIYTIVSKFLKSEKKDFYDELSKEEKEAIEEGIAQLDKGETVSYQEVKKELKTKYKI